jgi:hypothetical protein
VTTDVLSINIAKIMNLQVKEPQPLSPRFAGAVFFAIYALLFMLFTKYSLLSLKTSALLPLLPSIFISLIIGAFAGGIFGKILAKESHWLKPFLIGVLLACLVLILASLGVFLYSYVKDVTLSNIHHWQDYWVIYGTILLSLALTIGLWLIPVTGLIAIYFNKHFFPSLIAIDQKRLQEEKQIKTHNHDSE